MAHCRLYDRFSRCAYYRSVPCVQNVTEKKNSPDITCFHADFSDEETAIPTSSTSVGNATTSWKD